MPRKPLFKRKADEWIGECRDRMLSAKTVELLYKRGCPLVEIKELLGHSSVEQTIRYLGIGDADVAEAVMRYLPEYEKPLKVYLTPSGQQFKRN